MAKNQYIQIGSILKDKDGGADYLKVNLYKMDEVTLRSGDILQVETKSQQLKKADRLLEEGIITEDAAEKMREFANKMPDFVRAKVTLVRKNS